MLLKKILFVVAAMALLSSAALAQTAPVVLDIPNQTVPEGGTFATINLDTYVTDVDNLASEMTWTATGETELTVSIDAGTRVATITTPSPTWNGSETITFTATDPGLLSSSDPATFTVTAVNDAPVVSDIPDQTIAEGGTFATVDLDTYVSDVDNLASEMTWTATGQIKLTVSIDAGTHVATITPPTADWNGAETITFTATDPGLLSSSDPATFTVTAVNDAPVVLDIPNQTVPEGGSFATINLDTYVTDVDNLASEMTWTATGETELTVSIDPGTRVATITTSSPTWNGAETVTFTATDPGLLSSSDPATFTVSATNDPPVVSDIPDQTIAEGGTFATINLDTYVTDVDNLASEMTWTATGETELTVSIDPGTRVATITTPSPTWNGAETVTFTATDPGLLSGSDPATFTVSATNDPPVVSDIPDQTIAEGGTFTTITLDNYVTDIDNVASEMTWTATGQTELTVTIDPGTRVATITTPTADWNGAETVTFTATDPGLLSSSDPATFTVTAVNDAPVVLDIPNQTVPEGGTFATINLDSYVTDVDNLPSEMTWTATGQTELTVTIDPGTRVATITTPSPTWNGSETVTFTATDPGLLSGSDPATFTVSATNDPPVVSDIPDQTIAEGGTFATINLDTYVTDVDNLASEMTWTATGETELTVSIDAGTRVATITTPTVDWNGAETITFTATDPGLLSSSDPATFTVTAVNDAPVVLDIPNQTVPEGGTFATINLDTYVTDVDNLPSEMTWTATGQTELTVTIDPGYRVATIATPSPTWNGAETVTFTATDPGLLSSSDPATFTVSATNDPPVVSDIPDQTIAEGSTFATITLDNYVTDIDNVPSEMTWTATGETELTVSIDAGTRVATITPPTVDWNGAETITFTATDPGLLSSSDPATFTVTAVNDAPVVLDIPNQTVPEGGSFATINLDAYVTDVDNLPSEMTWTATGETELTVSIDPGTVWRQSRRQARPGTVPRR